MRETSFALPFNKTEIPQEEEDEIKSIRVLVSSNRGNCNAGRTWGNSSEAVLQINNGLIDTE